MKIRKIIIILIGILLISIMLNINNVQAALQSNGDANAAYDIDNWMLKIRQMQTLGGTLGLTDTINTSDLTSNSTNLDIHMQKNTEYGAMAILSASSYGNPNKINSGDTTTGNKTGVVMQINKEWVSAGAGITRSKIWKNAVARYKNLYSTSYVAKSGDAILDWHGSGANQWFYGSGSYGLQEHAALLRSYSGSIYSYYGYAYDGNTSPYTFDADYTKAWASRAVIVVGEGIND